MPCRSDKNEPLFSKPKDNAIWVLLLEKAWAKTFGSYMQAEAMIVENAMEDLLAAPAQGFWLE